MMFAECLVKAWHHHSVALSRLSRCSSGLGGLPWMPGCVGAPQGPPSEFSAWHWIPLAEFGRGPSFAARRCLAPWLAWPSLSSLFSQGPWLRPTTPQKSEAIVRHEALTWAHISPNGLGPLCCCADPMSTMNMAMKFEGEARMGKSRLSAEEQPN